MKIIVCFPPGGVGARVVLPGHADLSQPEIGINGCKLCFFGDNINHSSPKETDGKYDFVFDDDQ